MSCVVQSFYCKFGQRSQHHRVVWVGRTIKPSQFLSDRGQGHLPLDQVDQNPIQPALDRYKPSVCGFLWIPAVALCMQLPECPGSVLCLSLMSQLQLLTVSVLGSPLSSCN